jgi:hypothetical protein
MELLDILPIKQMVLISTAILALLEAGQRCMPRLRKSKAWQRMLPIIPLLLGVAAAFLPGTVDGTAGDRAIVGLICGWLASSGKQTIKRLILGRLDDQAGKGKADVANK